MGWKPVTQPASEPITLSEAKTHLAVDDSTHDTTITAAITAARIWVEKYLQSALIEQTIEIALDQFPSEIELPIGPAMAVTSVKYIDVDGNEQTIASTNYGLDDYSPRHWIIRAADYDWPDTYDMANAVKIRYTAGFGSAAADVPEPIKQAIKLIVGDMHEHREETITGVSISRLSWVESLLMPYRRLVAV